MAKTAELFVKLYAGMPEDPKVEPRSDAAFRTLIEAWCLCRRTGNDGKIPRKTWEKRWPKRARDELVTSGLIHVETDYVSIHNWLGRQASTELLEARRNAGRLGGIRSGLVRRASSKNEASASGLLQPEPKQTANQNEPKPEPKVLHFAATEEEEEEEKERGYVTGVRHVPKQIASTAPPETCPQHPTGTTQPCHACGEARRAFITWTDRAQRHALEAARAEREAASAVRAQAVAACTQCDDDGYLGTQVCDHDPNRIERARRGYQAARAALKRPDPIPAATAPGWDDDEPSEGQ